MTSDFYRIKLGLERWVFFLSFFFELLLLPFCSQCILVTLWNKACCHGCITKSNMFSFDCWHTHNPPSIAPYHHEHQVIVFDVVITKGGHTPHVSLCLQQNLLRVLWKKWHSCITHPLLFLRIGMRRANHHRVW